MKHNRYYTIKNLIQIENSELDFELYREVFPEVTSDIEEEDGNGWYTPIGNRTIDNHPINIDILINTLIEFKNKGANYVSINYHTDHIGYNLCGKNVYKSTEEEINLFRSNEEIRNKKIEEYRILQNKLENLKKEL